MNFEIYTLRRRYWNMTYHRVGNIVTRRVSLVEQELLTLPQHLSTHPVFSRFCVVRSLIVCVEFCRPLFVLLSFLVYHRIVCPSLIYIFWLPLWFLQTIFTEKYFWCMKMYDTYMKFKVCMWVVWVCVCVCVCVCVLLSN